MVEKIARGNVCVSPEIFPAKEMVAPNSPRLLAKARIAPLITPGIASGNVIVKKIRRFEAPKVFAASSKFLSTNSMDKRMDLVTRGNETTMAAIIAAGNENAILIPNQS